MGQICFENAKRDEFYGFYESWGSPDVGSPCILLRRLGGNYRANPHLRILRLLPRSLAPIPAADHTYLFLLAALAGLGGDSGGGGRTQKII